jgi:uncharacterized protein (DUF1330 family)
MASINPTAEQIQAFMSAPVEGPILMLNLLRFKADGGRDEYLRYGQLVQPHLARVGARVVFFASARATVIGGDTWDEVLIVEYPSRQAFLDMVGNEDYQAAASHRTRALADSRLYCTQAAALPG